MWYFLHTSWTCLATATEHILFLLHLHPFRKMGQPLSINCRRRQWSGLWRHSDVSSPPARPFPESLHPRSYDWLKESYLRCPGLRVAISQALVWTCSVGRSSHGQESERTRSWVRLHYTTADRLAKKSNVWIKEEQYHDPQLINPNSCCKINLTFTFIANIMSVKMPGYGNWAQFWAST